AHLLEGADLELAVLLEPAVDRPARDAEGARRLFLVVVVDGQGAEDQLLLDLGQRRHGAPGHGRRHRRPGREAGQIRQRDLVPGAHREGALDRSEEHTSDSSHGSISYAVFCLKKKKKQNTNKTRQIPTSDTNMTYNT